MEDEMVFKLLSEIEYNGFVYRKFMTIDEIKTANKMVDIGLLYKSLPDEKNATIGFFITKLGVDYLDENEK